MDDGRDLFSFVFGEIRAFEATAIPAISLDAGPAVCSSVKAIVAADTSGVAFVIGLEDLMSPDVKDRVLQLAALLSAPSTRWIC